MKKTHFIYFIFLITFFCKEKSENAPVDSVRNAGEVVVIFTVGDVKIGQELAKQGIRIPEGSEITVGNKSLIEIQFVNKGTEAVIRINQNSIFILNKKNIDNPKQDLVSVNQGEVMFDVKKAKSDEELMILTPSSAAGVRGTKFIVSVTKKIFLEWKSSKVVSP